MLAARLRRPSAKPCLPTIEARAGIARRRLYFFATSGQPHLSAHIRQWAGDSRGRWEGDTLVVDTTNFNDRGTFQSTSSSLHVVERFTRVSVDRILYQFTVDDPNTWTRPWSAEIPMLRIQGPLYEYACHEGNYGLPHILSGARFAEKEAAPDTARDPRR